MSTFLEIISYFTTGLAATMVGYSAAVAWMSPNAPPPLRKPEDAFSLGDLAKLASSHKELLKQSSLQIILDRAISPKYLLSIIDKCKDGRDPILQKQAICCIQQLSMKEENKSLLCKNKLPKLLCRILSMSFDNHIHRHALMALFALVVDNDRRKIRIVGYKVVKPLVHFITSSTTVLSDLKYCSIMMLHQLTLTEDTHQHLIDSGVISLFAKVSASTFGNTKMQKMCLHSLVRLLSSLDDDNSSYFEELSTLQMIPLISACLRNDDAELVSWSIFMLHEFSYRNVARKEIRKIKGLLKLLTPMMVKSDNIIPRIILRILKCLCRDDLEFTKSIIHANTLLPRIIKAMENEDQETQYWALSLLRELINMPISHDMFYENGGLKAIINAAQSDSNQALFYIADIIGSLCATGTDDDNKNIEKLANSGIVQTVFDFCNSEEEQLRYSGVALLLNFANVSKSLSDEIVESGGILLLSKFLNNSTRHVSQILACKTLIALSQKVLIFCLRPLFLRLAPIARECLAKVLPHLATDKIYPPDKDLERISLLLNKQVETTEDLADELLSLLTQNDLNTPKKVAAENAVSVEISCQQLITRLNCLDIFMRTNIFNDIQDEGAQSFELFMEDILNTTKILLTDIIAIPLLLAEEEKARSPELCLQLKEDLVLGSLNLVRNLIQYNSFQKDIQDTELIILLYSLFEQGSERTCLEIIPAYTSFLRNGLSGNEITPKMFFGLLKYVTIQASSKLWHDFRQFSSLLCNGCQDVTISNNFVHCDDKLSTDHVSISMQTSEVENISWTFESARASHGVTGSGKYAYEFRVGSSGMMQIGWATALCDFDPILGHGVGDDKESYAFDGYRVKKWHAQFQNNHYGQEWQGNDVVTCMIDLDEATMSFLLNGIFLGVAFSDIDTSKVWCPALSLTSNEWGKFSFGSPLDRLLYCPYNYTPIGSSDQRVESPTMQDGAPKEPISPQSKLNIEFSQTVPDIKNEEMDYDLEIASKIFFKTRSLCSSPTSPVRRGIYDRAVSASPTTSFASDATEIFDRTMSLSFYYEVGVGLISLDEITLYQIGVELEGLVIICVVINPILQQLAVVKYDSRLPIETLKLHLDDVFSYNEISAVRVFQIISDIVINNGDFLGCGLFLFKSSIFFILNGIRIGKKTTHVGDEVTLERVSSCIPYIRNIPRFILEFGQREFLYEQANIDRYCILAWSTSGPVMDRENSLDV